MEYMGDDTETETETQSVTEENPSDSTNTALINSDICPGMSAGDTLELKITKVLDSGEYEVEYKESEPPPEEMSEEPAPSSEMDSYMG